MSREEHKTMVLILARVELLKEKASAMRTGIKHLVQMVTNLPLNQATQTSFTPRHNKVVCIGSID